MNELLHLEITSKSNQVYFDYIKVSASLRGWLHGKSYYEAIAAMEFAYKNTDGFRKDGVTPEFQHQISMASFARTISGSLLFPEAVMSTIFCHDLVEDKDITLKDLENILQHQDIIQAIELLTNHVDGVKKDKATMYAHISSNPIASIVKGIDRMHNLQTMQGVFSPEKQAAYILEAETYILPMLKQARKHYPNQENAYQNIRYILLLQNELLKAALDVRISEKKEA